MVATNNCFIPRVAGDGNPGNGDKVYPHGPKPGDFFPIPTEQQHIQLAKEQGLTWFDGVIKAHKGLTPRPLLP
ncbi:hypothetical protein MMC20_004164 [Loxospora ochrophaea]|nr:hypothetical protein [Loxospora ochrophaea]